MPDTEPRGNAGTKEVSGFGHDALDRQQGCLRPMPDSEPRGDAGTKEVSGFGHDALDRQQQCLRPMPDSEPRGDAGTKEVSGFGHDALDRQQQCLRPMPDTEPRGDAGSESGIGPGRPGHRSAGSGRSQTPPGACPSRKRCLASATMPSIASSNASGRCLTPNPEAMRERSQASARDGLAIGRRDLAEARHRQARRSAVTKEVSGFGHDALDRQQQCLRPMPDSEPRGDAGTESGIGPGRPGHRSAGPGRSQTPPGACPSRKRCPASATMPSIASSNASGRCLTPNPEAMRERSQASARDGLAIGRRDLAEARHRRARRRAITKEVSGFGHDALDRQQGCLRPMPDSEPRGNAGSESGIGPGRPGHRPAGSGRSQTPPGAAPRRHERGVWLRPRRPRSAAETPPADA